MTFSGASGIVQYQSIDLPDAVAVIPAELHESLTILA
jgi:hypothetical protein